MATLEYSRTISGGPGWTKVQLSDGRVVTVKGDRAIRNNNPGNIEYGPFTRSKGALGTDRRFAVFPTQRAGLEAQADLLFEAPHFRNLTLAQAIAKYAPEFENDTAAYQRRVSQLSGIPLSTKMSDIPASKRADVMSAMHKVEGNTSATVLDSEGNRIGRVDNSAQLDLRGSDQPAWGAIGGRSMTGYTPGRPGVGTPAAGAVGARSMAGWGGNPPTTFAAPLGAPVERAPLSSVEDIAKAQAYGDYARSRTMSPARPDNMNYAGPKGAFSVGAMPSLPATAPVPSLLSPEEDYFGPKVDIPKGNPAIDPINVQAIPTPTPAPRAEIAATPPMASNEPIAPGFPAPPPQMGFPEAPPAPGKQARTEAMKGAVLGGLKGGPIGAVLGGLLAPGIAQIGGNIASNRLGIGNRVNPLNGLRDAYRGMFGGMGRLGGLLSPPTYATPYSVGSGYSAIGGVFGGPPGATAYSRSNPNISFTSLGNGMVSRTNKDTGVTYNMAPGDYDAGSRSKSSKSDKSSKK